MPNAKPSPVEAAKTRQTAELVVQTGLELIPNCDEKVFANISRATLEAAQILDALPTTGGRVSSAERVKLARAQRLSAAQNRLSAVPRPPD